MTTPRWLITANRWADQLEAEYMTPWLGPPKDWHSWIYHTVIAMVVGGITGAVIGHALAFFWAWPSALLGYAIGSTCAALVYIWREGLARFAGLDGKLDIVGPVLNAVVAWWVL